MTEYRLFQDTFSIQLPENFSDMDDKAASIMYQAQNRPPIIKTDGVASIAFNRTQTDTNMEEMPQIIRMTKMNFKNLQPGNQFFEEGCEKLENIEYGWFDHKGYALDGEIYYLCQKVKY